MNKDQKALVEEDGSVPIKKKPNGKSGGPRKRMIKTECGWVKAEAEKIIDFNICYAEREWYCVKWLGWPDVYNKWVANEDFSRPWSMIVDYWKDVLDKADQLNAPRPVQQASVVSSPLGYLRAFYS